MFWDHEANKPKPKGPLTENDMVLFTSTELMRKRNPDPKKNFWDNVNKNKKSFWGK